MFEQVSHFLEDSPFRKPEKEEVITNAFSSEEFGLPNPEKMADDEAIHYLAKVLVEWYTEKINGKQ